jgi:hypothetical protein
MNISRVRFALLVIGLIVIAGGAGYFIGYSRGSVPDPASQQAAIKATSGFDILKDIEGNSGKKATLSGRIYKVQADYFLSEANVPKPSGIKLNFSKSKIDPAQYSNQADTTPNENNESVPQLKGPYKVSGTLQRDKTSGAPYLVIDSIK